jgi:ferredoxin
MKNKVRIIFQIVFFGLILYVAARPVFDKSYLADFEKYCPFGGISSFFSQLNNGTMACNMNETQVFLGFGLLLGAALIGKLFCSHVCPIGSVSEWIGKLGDKLKIRKELPKSLDRYFRSLKYVLLFVTVYYTMTSSELFCKTFDPYFASVNLFNSTDIVLYYAIPAFLVTIGGALIFRLFWCKYLCPLGAMSNIFMNVPLAGTVLILFFVSNYFGVGLSYIWLLGGLVVSGLVNEIGFMKSFMLPFPIIRRSDTCSSCGFCDAKCPQGIDISSQPFVNHIDCNLCSDCVHSCPKKNVLTINKKNNFKYIAPVMVVALIGLSLGFTNYFEFKTISMRWGNFSNKDLVYIQNGLKSVKCYGSAMALAGTLQGVDGIHGLDAYAKTHTVKIFYDPDIISEAKVKATLFTPVKIMIRNPGKDTDIRVSVLDIGVYGLFDQIDFNNLKYVLKGKNGIYGFETHFGEPVKTTVYFDQTKINPAEIRRSIENEYVIIKTENGEEKVRIEFKAENDGIVKESIFAKQYKKLMFDSFDEELSDYENYKPEELMVFQFAMPEATNALRESLDYLVSYLSSNDGIVKFTTGMEEAPYGYVYFDAKKIKLETIKSLLAKKKITIFISETETEEIDNPFHIIPEGKLYKANEIDN